MHKYLWLSIPLAPAVESLVSADLKLILAILNGCFNLICSLRKSDLKTGSGSEGVEVGLFTLTNQRTLSDPRWPRAVVLKVSRLFFIGTYDVKNISWVIMLFNVR